MNFIRKVQKDQGGLLILEIGVDPWDGFSGLCQYKLFQYSQSFLIQVPFRAKGEQMVTGEKLDWVPNKKVLI